MNNFPLYRCICIISAICEFAYMVLSFNNDPMQIPSVILTSFFILITVLTSDISLLTPNVSDFLMKKLLQLSIFGVGLLLINTIHPIYTSSILFCLITAGNIALTWIESKRPQVLISD